MSAQKKVLITGCTPGGIGHALALEFHRRGCHVIATARSVDKLKDLEKMGMSTLALDVTSLESIAECKERAAMICKGSLDILVNNAGLNKKFPALDLELEDVKAMFETNVYGPMFMVKAFAPLLIQARGLIINVSSNSSLVPYIFASAYTGTKGALNSYSNTLRLELKPFNVRVMVAMTGTVKSNVASREHRPLPTNSLYYPAKELYEEKMQFSQKTDTMLPGVYAERLVGKALKGEGWFGGWFGRTPNWYFVGGLARGQYLLTFFPWWFSEWIVGTAVMKIGSFARQINEARAKTD